MWRIWRRDPFRTNVIDCRWQRTSDGWKLWVRDRPRVAGRGATYSSALAALESAIMLAARDLDTVLPIVPEFWPPLPAVPVAERYLQPKLLSVSGDAIFESERFVRSGAFSPDIDFDGLFRGGICPVCGVGRGPRTEVPIRIASAPPYVHGGWIRCASRDSLHVYSQEFLGLLSPSERDRLSLLEVEMPSGDRRRFFELRGPAGVRPVGVREFQSDAISCEACGDCAVEVVDPRLREAGFCLWEFLCAEDLPTPVPTVFPFGHGNRVKLCFRQDRWAELQADRRTLGLMTSSVGVVPPSECERTPRVRGRGGSCETCSRWPAPRTIAGEKMAVFGLPATTCSRENFTWLAAAERAGEVQIVAATLPPIALYERSQQPGALERTEYVGMRCPRCWRLGWIVLSQDPAELSLAWQHGL